MNTHPTAAEVFDIPAGTRFRDHAHDGLHLCAVLNGGFRESLTREERVMLPGWVRLSASARHDIRFGNRGASCLLIEVGSEDACGTFPRPPARPVFRSDPWAAQLALRLGRTIAVGGSEPVRTELVLELLAELARQESGRTPGPPPRWLLAARDRLADEWRAPPRADRLALAAGVHRVHLVRSFRDHFGCTIGAFVRRRRVAEAARLLAETDLPLALVAHTTGFADQAHLTRTIRRATGRTPRALRYDPKSPGLHRFKTRLASWR